MSDYQHPETKQSPLMTVAGVLEWLSGEREDLQAAEAIAEKQIQKDMIHYTWLYLDVLMAKLTGATMEALDARADK